MVVCHPDQISGSQVAPELTGELDVGRSIRWTGAGQGLDRNGMRCAYAGDAGCIRARCIFPTLAWRFFASRKRQTISLMPSPCILPTSWRIHQKLLHKEFGKMSSSWRLIYHMIFFSPYNFILISNSTKSIYLLILQVRTAQMWRNSVRSKAACL